VEELGLHVGRIYLTRAALAEAGEDEHRYIGRLLAGDWGEGRDAELNEKIAAMLDERATSLEPDVAEVALAAWYDLSGGRRLGVVVSALTGHADAPMWDWLWTTYPPPPPPWNGRRGCRVTKGICHTRQTRRMGSRRPRR